MQRGLLALLLLAGCVGSPTTETVVLRAGAPISYAVGGLVDAGARLAAAQVTAVGTDLEVALTDSTMLLTPTIGEPGTAIIEWEAVDAEGAPVDRGTLRVVVEADPTGRR